MKMHIRQIWMALFLAPLMLMAQEVTVLKQRKFPKTVPAGNYSGIAWMGGSKYAVANDKSPTTGFYLMNIQTDSISGELLSVRLDTFLTCGQPTRDEEGICYMPQNQTVFVSGEKDQEIIEFNRFCVNLGDKYSLQSLTIYLIINTLINIIKL